MPLSAHSRSVTRTSVAMEPGNTRHGPFETQESAECWFGEPIIDRDRAAVEYWAVLKETGDKVTTIVGTSMLRFDSEGLCCEQRDTWVTEEGRHEPYEGWGK